MADTINGSNVNPEPSMIKVTHDVNGNVIYPVTREEAVILKDGTLLSDKIESLHSITEVNDFIRDQFNAMDQQAELIQSSLENVNAITEDILVYDDDMLISVDTEVDAIDYQSIINNVNETVMDINAHAVMHEDDDAINVPITTLYGQIIELKRTINSVSNRLTILENRYSSLPSEFIMCDDDENSADSVLVPELSEELAKMNNTVLSFAERVGRLEANDEYCVVYEDESVLDSNSPSGEMDLVALRAALGDSSQLPENTDVIELLLQLVEKVGLGETDPDYITTKDMDILVTKSLDEIIFKEEVSE